MQWKFIVLTASQVFAIATANNVFTATRVYHTLITKSPFLVDVTSVTTWTEGSSISATDVTTAAPTPTIAY
ncbi:hypothetical protein HYPSUDRAFT_201838 [Hypholoma sublateritium FD-334 SS-4]|uniref:Uncharacterized protein n=1 Tax=Hypholoma sublateritium (strain FD-334 SS-4) TaxID=945553 RepID=A0A0D2P226_HYPSF|nr:hypothetical protein HYPSUDRAFT_201838 [Hypholoma sublateritium FD-334 SS-4]